VNKITKDISIIQGIGVVITTLLGSGIFIVPAMSATLAGGNSLIGWVLVSLFIIPITYIFGIFGKKYPHIEGSAYFVQNAFGEKIGKTIGLMYLSIIPIGPPVVIITGASYLTSLFSNNKILLLISLLMIGVIFILNQYKFSISSKIGLVIVFLILLIIGIIAYNSLFQSNEITFKALDNNFFKSIGIIFWCFVGIESISHLSSEFKNKNDFLKVVIYGIIIVGFLYTLVAFSVLKYNIFGNEILNIQSLILIFDTIIPFYGKIIISVIGFFICLIAVNLYVASSTRILYSYTKGKLTFNKSLTLIVLSITITTTLKIVYGIKLETLILYANGVFVLIYFFVGLSGIKLLKNIDKIIAIVATIILATIIYFIGLSMIYAIGVFVFLLIATKLQRIKCLKSLFNDSN